MKKIIEYFKSGHYKEEIVTIPLLILGFFVVNWIFGILFPESALFDPVSQMETIIFRFVAYTITLIMAWLGLRIMFPDIYRFLHEHLYENFKSLPAEQKLKWGLTIFLTLLLSAALVSSGRAGTREELTKHLYTQLNVREVTPNSSPEIDMYLRSVGVKIPAPWCVAFVSWNLSYFDIPNPQSAWSPNFALKKDIIWTPKKPSKPPLAGDVFTLYYSSLGRVGHGGFFIREDKSGYFITIEGNTNGSGSRDGDGVYLKKRDPEKIYAISRFINP